MTKVTFSTINNHGIKDVDIFNLNDYKKTVIMKKSILFISVLTASIALHGCSEGNAEAPAENATAVAETTNETHGQSGVKDDVSQANILNIAIGSPDHTTLVAAVQAAQIEDVLVNAGPLTVFAPTNEAFGKLPAGTVEELVKPENKAKLAGILTMHASPGNFNDAGLRKEARKGRKMYMASGDYLTVVVDDNDDIYVGGAKVLGFAPASNGMVVVVDALVDPTK